MKLKDSKGSTMEAAIRTQELNPGKLPSLFRKQFELCRLDKGQTVAIVSDLGTRREYIQAAFAAAEDLGVDIYEMCVNSIPGWTKVGVPTIGQCKGTLEALMRADMIADLPRAAVQQVAEAGDGRRRARADDHRRARRPRAAACRRPASRRRCCYAHALYERTKRGARHQRGRHRLRYRCGEYPVMTQYGMPTSPAISTIGACGHMHTFPNEGSATARW